MMPAALLAVLLMPFGFEGPPLLAMGWSIDRMLDMAAIVAGWSQHLRAAPLLTPLALLLGLAALAWFAFFKDRWRLVGPVAALVVLVVFAVDRPPDALVADTTKAVAIRGPTGLELADGKAQSFALTVWRETYADPIATPAVTSCDATACIGQSSAGFTYALVEDSAAFADECGRADLIIARVPPPSWCTAKALIGPDDLATHGVRWLRWNAGTKSFEIRASIDNLARSWRIPPRS
jgi:competence protein ComEC